MSANDVQPAFTKEHQQRALRVVLDSATFAKNPRLAVLLRYLCQRFFRGETESIKEYSIATDVFGRPSDFDQSTDAIVRVEMHRLRKKLKDFYAGEGANQPVQIVIQNGHYLPEFVSLEKEAETKSPALELTSQPVWKPIAVEAAPPPRRFNWIVVASLSVLLAVALALLAFVLLNRKSRLALAHPSDVSAPLGAIVPGNGFRILCGHSGSGYRDKQGNLWSADAFFSGGSAVDLGSQPIYRTSDSFLFRAARSGEFSYRIPLKSGVYEMRLYFADTNYSLGPAMEGGENVRVFNVLLNGEPALRNFDIINEAGPNTADIKVFKDVQPASDGYLHLATSKLTDLPLLNAIEIEPGIPHHLRPIRIVTQENTLTDRAGGVWSPDNFFLGGRTIARFGTVVGPDDPQVYERERYGNFSYAIPVAAGRYSVTLHFAETYWGPKSQGGGGTGNRIFDVYCNGTTLLKNFDMFSEAGSHRQLIKSFHGLQPNAQGTLLFHFAPIVNYANLSAIEVLDESE